MPRVPFIDRTVEDLWRDKSHSRDNGDAYLIEGKLEDYVGSQGRGGVCPVATSCFFTLFEHWK